MKKSMEKMKKMKLKISKGSVLVFSLIVLSMILVMALGISAVTITERKTASGTGKSIKAFENAESGVEEAIYAIKNSVPPNNITARLNDGNFCNKVFTESGGVYTCSDGYKIMFLDELGSILPSNGDINEIASIKSVGTYSDTVRAVETAWAATATGGIVGGCVVNGSTDTIVTGFNWGEGCKSEGTTLIDDCREVATSTDYECGTSAYATYHACICVKVL